MPPAGLALLMTQSRAALYGAALGVLVLALARYRWLLGPLALMAVGVLTVGRGSGIVTRFLAGLHGQDAATQLRFREFENALQLIRDYPVFGVGFGDAPRIDLQTGVSSVYLTVAERSGLIGLALFTVVGFKVFFVDLASLDQFYRIIAFILLGVVVLSGSLLYLKYRQNFAIVPATEGETP